MYIYVYIMYICICIILKSHIYTYMYNVSIYICIILIFFFCTGKQPSRSTGQDTEAFSKRAQSPVKARDGQRNRLFSR